MGGRRDNGQKRVRNDGPIRQNFAASHIPFYSMRFQSFHPIFKIFCRITSSLTKKTMIQFHMICGKQNRGRKDIQIPYPLFGVNLKSIIIFFGGGYQFGTLLILNFKLAFLLFLVLSRVIRHTSFLQHKPSLNKIKTKIRTENINQFQINFEIDFFFFQKIDRFLNYSFPIFS